MVAKRSLRALALLLALPSAALALGLGDIRLLSPLNAPLDAEVDLVDVAPDEANTVQAQLASRETFARYGLDWPAYLAGVQVRTVRAPDGRQMLKLRSTEAISEPFITLLVDVNWSRGHLVREYTMLLDPPVYTPGGSAVASAPVSAPATGSGAREGAIARGADPPARDADPPPATRAPESSAASTAPPARASAAGGEAGGESLHVVQRGETLSAIASSEAGAGANTARTRSFMVAIYQANPRAFEKNMNVLHSGAVLRIPDAAQAATVSPSEAAAEIRRQYAAWRSSTPAAPSGERPGQLKLVTPSESPSVGVTPGAAPSAEVGQLKGRVHDLEGQLAESKRLLELKNADLARLQEQLAAKQAPPPAAPAPPPAAEAAPPKAAPAPPVPAPAAPAHVEQAPAAEQAPAPQAAPPPVAEEKPSQPAAEAPPPVSAQPAPAPPAAGGSLFDTLMGYWWEIALLLVALVAFAGSRIVRARRAAQFDDSLGRLTGAASETAFAGGRGFASPEAPLRGASPEPGFLVEETAEQERPRFPAGAAPAAATARHVASDETISSETAINLDQGDPLAEADFHMAYGLYDQAADLIRIAIGREPARRDLRLKLLEVFFVWGNKEQFLQAARELADSRAEAAPGEWEKILIMGKQLAPEDPLFSGAGAVSGATAGGVDLDLEGGQSRVDFDLAGETIAGDATERVDLDLGAAFGDRTDSPTNVTDRNAALLENAFLSTTGTTRQMTGRMRQDGSLGATGELEGPTVEQPAIAATQEQPTIQQRVASALKQGGSDQTAELAIDDLGLDVGQVDTVDQPGLAAASTPDGPTLVAGLDDHSRRVMEDAQQRRRQESRTDAWQFDQDELEGKLAQTSPAMPDSSPTSRLAALGAREVDVDLGDASGMHPAAHSGDVDLDVGVATGTHAANGGALDLDVGTATLPESAFAATQRLSSEDLALPDLEPVTMSEVGTKLDLARAYMDMGDPDGARNILEEVLAEGSAAQKQEAQRLMESLPG